MKLVVSIAATAGLTMAVLVGGVFVGQALMVHMFGGDSAEFIARGAPGIGFFMGFCAVGIGTALVAIPVAVVVVLVNNGVHAWHRLRDPERPRNPKVAKPFVVFGGVLVMGSLFGGSWLAGLSDGRPWIFPAGMGAGLLIILFAMWLEVTEEKRPETTAERELRRRREDAAMGLCVSLDDGPKQHRRRP